LVTAYLTVKAIEITHCGDMDIPLSAKLTYTNSGTTPNPLPLHEGKSFPHLDLGAGASQDIHVIGGENYDMKAHSIAQS
jgi:hypothetical protein